MSRPTDIYEDFSRPLLENFTWQLQNTGVVFEASVEEGVAIGASIVIHYAFECPTVEAADRLREYIYEQADDEISIESAGESPILRGRVDEFPFELPTLLKWVGYMCDAGSQVEARFDGWNPKAPVAVDIGSAPSRSAAPHPPSPTPAVVPYPHRVTARIPQALEPMDRGATYEDPLSAALKLHRVGEVTGGGSQLNANGGIEFVELELSLANLDEALALTKKTLRQLGAPKGSELHVFQTTVVPVVD